MKKTSAIILAAGVGKRMGTATPKQFLEIRGKRVVDYTIEAFKNTVNEVVVVTPEIGGKTRFESVKNGLKRTKGEYIIVHDAVRPFVDEKIINQLIKNVVKYPAVGIVMPVVETIVEEENGFLKLSPDRSKLKESQTPQAFQRKWLEKALEKPKGHKSELLELIRLVGGKVKLLKGSPWYFKITYKPDIYAAEGYLAERKGRVAIVTGGTRGIGKRVAERLEDAGIKVVTVARGKEADFRTDVKDPKAVASTFKKIAKKFGRLDILVNSAGIAELAEITETTDQIWEEVLRVNLFGTFYCLREAMKLMNNGGVIVNIASSSLAGGRKGLAAYGASKAALAHLSQVAALEGRERDVSVFTVCPVRTDTGLRRKMFPNEDRSKLADPDEPAKIIAFCCINDLSPLSGQVFWLRDVAA